MPTDFFKKGLNLLLKRQTNILSAAFVIMVTVILSQVLGLVRQRLLVSIFGASNTLGVYLASSRLPDFLFQLIIAGALSSAFIPIFSSYLAKNKQEDANRLASTLLSFSLLTFAILALVLFIFAPYFSGLMAPGFSHEQITLMGNLTRIIIFGEILFMIGSFLSAILQSFHRFFVAGFAAALYNLGIIIGIVLLSPMFGIYSAAYGVILGALIFVVAQIPGVLKVGFSFKPSLEFRKDGMKDVLQLMWPRTIGLAIFQLGTILTVTLVSLIPNPGRNYVIFDYAQILSFAPIVLFGQSIAQAAFPVLSKEKDKIEEFKATFMTSFNQILYLMLPISVLFLVLRIPIVRLVFGAAAFDWEATVLTGRTLAFFSISLFAQALVFLVARGFYAMHDAKTPLYVGAFSTAIMLGLGFLFVTFYKLGAPGIAFAYSLGSIVNFFLLLIFLDRKIGSFDKVPMSASIFKILVATFFTGFALYIPIKLLDQLVFDTTRTINLLILTGIASFAGLSLYLFLTWLFNVKEAQTFLYLFRKIGNWKEILGKSEEIIVEHRANP
ncbi:MAG: murein biosynthesis integral membrane protein MurJ [Candidatus Levybacteria bacterium]|nr:murein biosynthesis integral membrane protein MurJ [Candidatus Levybacteria bacterium]